ncbi:D-alanyl-D-alanine carboxypeptidase [Chitinophaga sp. YR573]|uniref:M15 family metallopeptidase n=1 Tax=Chitinophaga sp. YR573 TaxID=1881040 RepID=UPI0008BF5F72|nr:M15 family metallopeptidase [Chitinophaga sp. YR573]SEW45190.1 D-alanyl-D-alanine carboxypeptidase [Chitinophaga sp. YR573]
MRKKHTPYASYDDLLCEYYGHHKPRRKKQKGMTQSFDNGEVIPGKDTEPFQEYVVSASVDKDGDVFEEYVVQASVTNDSNEEYVVYEASYDDTASYSPVSYSASQNAYSPVSQNQDLYTDVLSPFSNSKSDVYSPNNMPADRPAYTSPDKSSYIPSTPSHTPNISDHNMPDADAHESAELMDDLMKIRGSDAPPAGTSKEDDIVNDLQAILSGKKVYDPVAKKTVNREDLGKQQSIPSPQPAHANNEPTKNEHAIFDRIAQNMQFANAYNLGTIQIDSEELNNRFNQFEETPAPKKPAAPKATAPVNKPSPVSKEESFDPSEFLNDLEDMHKQQRSNTVATVTPDNSVQMSEDFPPRPTNLRPITSQERATEFGTFTFVADPSTFDGDGIRVTNNWYHDNITAVSIPQLNGKRFGSHVIQNGTINFHKAGADRLKRLWSAWEAAGLLDRIQTFEGGYAARYIRGTQQRSPRPLSNHAWGTAFDINAPWNGFGKEPAQMGQTGCLRELVAIANQQGFFWGGHFGKKDGMHFELGKVV